MIKKLLACAATASLAIAPVAAQANTRASESQVSLSNVRVSAQVDGEAEDIFAALSPFLIAVIVGTTIVAVIEITDSKGIIN